MQGPQLGARLDTDLLHQRRARFAVRLERLRLATAPIERQHALGVQVLAQRFLHHERRELADDVGVPAGVEVGADRHLRRAQAQLAEAANLRARERLVSHVRQRLSAPQPERLAPAGRVEQTLGERGVDVALRQLELVAATARHDARAVARQRPAQVGDVQLDHLRRARGRRLPPQALGQAIGRDGPTDLQREHREHGPLLAGAQRDGAIVEADLDRPQKPHIHRCTRPYSRSTHR